MELTALGLSEQGLSLIGSIEGATFAKLEDLVDLVGGNDLATVLPDDVRSAFGALDGLALESVTLDLGPKWEPVSAGASVGLAHLQTRVLPGFEIDGLSAGFSVAHPFGPDRAVSVVLGGETRFAGTPLDVAIQLPDSASLERTDEVVRKASQVILDTPGTRFAVAFAGFSGATRANSANAGAIFVGPAPFEERVKHGPTADQLRATLQRRLSEIKEADIFVIPPP